MFAPTFSFLSFLHSYDHYTIMYDISYTCDMCALDFTIQFI